MLRRSYKSLFLMAALILMLACGIPTLGSAPAPIPTFDSNAPLTAIVETANAAATQTAIYAPPTPTATVPTKTPFPTPTPTVTFIYIPPTSDIPPTQIPLGNSEKQFDCQVLATQPKRALAPNEGFKGIWTVANIGKAEWDENNLDFAYAEGDKFHLQPVYDFPVSVAPGVVVELSVDMIAPSAPGNYTTTWKINRGNSTFCPLILNIAVQ